MTDAAVDAHATPSGEAGAANDRLRGIRLFLLALGLFVFLTAELYPVGAMPDMTRDLGSSEAQVGRLVTDRKSVV